jgi:hypothetical protein
LQGLEREQPPAHQQRGEDRRQCHQQEQRREADQRRRRALVQADGDLGGVECARSVQREAGAHDPLQALDQRPAHHDHAAAGGEQDGEGGQLGGARHLPALACLLEASL